MFLSRRVAQVMLVCALTLVLVTTVVYLQQMVHDGQPLSDRVRRWTLLTSAPALPIVGAILTRGRVRIALLVCAGVLLVPGCMTSLFLGLCPAAALVFFAFLGEIIADGPATGTGRRLDTDGRLHPHA